MRLGWVTAICLAAAPGWSVATANTGAADDIPEIFVTGRSIKPSVNEPAYSTTVLNRDDLDLSAGARLDDALRAVPGFGLFRRQSSRAAHPTTQGVTLRGIGPSGAGRTLILLDGIPQNDPFGGWVDWSRIPSASLDTAALTRGGGAGPWGNTALAGVIRLQSRDLKADGGGLEASAGPHDTFDATAYFQSVGDKAAFHGVAHGHRTDGSFLIRENQRGSADRRAADQGEVVELGVRYALSDATVVRAVGKYSESEFINGFDVAESKTRIADAAFSVLHDPASDTAWEINAYIRDQGFRAVFAAVNATRTTATASLDQFDVPADAFGANAIVRHRIDDRLSIDTGADARFVDGETNENFQNLGQGFTRVRRAGGEQSVAGAFTELNWQPNEALLATIGGRVDAWRQADGLRQETVIQTGALARNDRFANRDGTVGTARAGVRYTPEANVAYRMAAYTGFRVPTLNELYRPFRVGNDITEANAALDVERLKGFDAGIEWTPSARVQFDVTYFHTILKNAVTNVTVQTTPGLNALLGVTVPAGGVLRQRQNIDRIVANGLEVNFTAALSDDWRFGLGYLLTRPEVSRSPQQPALRGLSLAQVPHHQGNMQLKWVVSQRFTLATQVRGATKQFDDDANIRVLRGFLVADVSGEFALTDQSRIVLAVENAFDRTVEAGRSADGIVSVATPRTARLGVRVGF